MGGGGKLRNLAVYYDHKGSGGMLPQKSLETLTLRTFLRHCDSHFGSAL